MLCVSRCQMLAFILICNLVFFSPKENVHFLCFLKIFYRIFHVEKLMNTNLIFIMVESKGTCPCDTRLLIQAEQTSDGPDPCDMVKQPRYRKGPDVCFDNNVLEDYTDCGGVSGLNPSLWSIIGVQFLLLWLLSGSRHCQLWPSKTQSA